MVHNKTNCKNWQAFILGKLCNRRKLRLDQEVLYYVTVKGSEQQGDWLGKDKGRILTTTVSLSLSGT